MPQCNLLECYHKRKMVERHEIGALAGFLNRCNSNCHLNPGSAYRAETNRRMRQAYAGMQRFDVQYQISYNHPDHT